MGTAERMSNLTVARCGQRYRTLHEAREHFARLVSSGDR